ncbi:MAG: Hint domain-containing protein [Roseovarius sp.]|nr:Hint domain-containing protein [Roseovarius sp.]
MATIFDLIEVTNISSNTTYSVANGNLLGVVEAAVSSEFDDGEFDEGDVFTLDGQSYQIDEIEEPSSNGQFITGDGSVLTFSPQSESNLDVIFLTVSNGGGTRYFIIPSDGYGDLNITQIQTGGLNGVGGSDAALVSTTDNQVNIVCFCAGTMIRLGNGSEIRVEDLKPGNQVATVDRGVQTVRWAGQRTLSVPTMLRHPRLRPIVIPAGALGLGVPERDLHVSPQHRVLLRSRIARRMFDADEVLVAAKHLVGMNGIRTDHTTWKVTYVHLLLDRHEILLANGAPCESLFLGPQSQRSLGPDVMDEIEMIFGGIPDVAVSREAARPFIPGRRARQLVTRHQRNGKCLLEPEFA